ncbi:MAG TPA: proline dehydrogenase family protein [Longimicrobiales bacterium]|nr:proline dehydrogenase family protein [Longimicrobiales bacterium]
MLRTALLWASKNPFLANRLPTYGCVRRATARFMPGETLEDALREAARLKGEGVPTTFTLLGENVTTPAEADAVADHYLAVLEAVRARGLDTEVSVKPTQLGLDLGPTEARRRLERIVRACDPGSLVWVDMESSAYVDPTLELFRAVREDHENAGLCLQSYLYRTEKDLESLLPLRPAIRLVKGAYKEPPGIAFPKKSDVDRNFVRLAGTLLRARLEGRGGRPVVGTHDPRMIAEAGRLAHELGLAKDAWEVAMLYGIKTAEQERLVRTGHSVRVLVAYGTHWFPWYMRRLAERPANVWFVVKQLVG